MRQQCPAGREDFLIGGRAAFRRIAFLSIANKKSPVKQGNRWLGAFQQSESPATLDKIFPPAL